MIFGSLSVDHEAITTHRDTYLLDQLSVISVRRPFLPMGLLLALGLSGFGIACFHLLFAHELILIAAVCILCLVGGWFIGQLQLLSRDLRGSELMGAVYGSYSALNKKRQEIMTAKRHTTDSTVGIKAY